MNPVPKLNLLLIVLGIVLGALGLSNLIFGWPPFTFVTTEVVPIGESIYTIDWLYTEPPPPEPGPFDIRAPSDPAWAALSARFEKTQKAIDAIQERFPLPYEEADFTILPRGGDREPIVVVINDPESWQDYVQKRNKAAAFFRKQQIDPCDAMMVWLPEDRSAFEQRVGNEPMPAGLRVACGDMPSGGRSDSPSQ